MADKLSSIEIAKLIREGILLINDGYRAKNSELSKTGLPFARAGNIDGGFHFDDADRVPPATLSKVGIKRSKPGDVVFTSKGTVGRFAFVREETPEFVYSPQLCFWRSGDRSRLHPRWLFYWMNGREFYLQFKGVAGQTDMAEYVSLRDQRGMKIKLPPLSEQKAIASVLGSLDDKIELNRRMNVSLEKMARAVFRSWFVDFDPVRAKLDGRQPPGLDTATATLFPDSFQDSSLGPIPQSWQVGSILAQASVISGGTPKTNMDAYWDGTIPWASAKDISQCNDAFLIATERKITDLGLAESSTKMIASFSTVVVARGATTGRLAMLGETMAMNQTCYGLHSKFDVPFALYCQARDFIDRMVHAAHGSVFDTITTRTVETTDVILPNREILESFEATVSPLFKRILLNIQESRILAGLRDTLLPELLSGKTSVRAASDALEATL